jgi:hypothetical protein
VKNIDWIAPIIENGKLSIGRLLLLIVFGIMIYMWLATIVVPASLETAFLTMVAYNFGKKVRDVAGEWVVNKKAKLVIEKGLEKLENE